MHSSIKSFPIKLYSSLALPSRRKPTVCTKYCDPTIANGIYQPFFDLYISAVCMKGTPDCIERLHFGPALPSVEIQMEIVDAIQLYNMVIDIRPIQGLLVRLMMTNNVTGIQEALSALTDHYEALDRLQKLSDSL